MSWRAWSMLVVGLVVGGSARGGETGGVDFFESRVRPVLVERCYGCHSAQAKELKGKLRLDTPEGILKGGDSDMPAVVGGKPDDSLMLNAVRWGLDDLRMPPKKKLADGQIADIEAWIRMGAPMPKGAAATQPVAKAEVHWSFVAPKMPVVPGVGEASASQRDAAKRGGETDVDRFVAEKLRENHLGFAPEADRRTLIRRVTYDLTGLPPTAGEVDAFVADQSPNAYERLVDRLLASPRYGEKWGRHWLDVARYADTKGYVFNEERRYPFSYTYRDWVIDAFNRDLPYDRFLIDQLAADRVVVKKEGGAEQRDLAALGFLTLGRRFINNQHDIIDDRIDVTCRGMMALTVACARCHDHKYDPIPTADYYSLYGVFASSTEPGELPLLGTSYAGGKEREAYEKEHARLVKEREDFVTAKRGEIGKQLRSAGQVAAYLMAAQRQLAQEAELPFDTVDDGKTLNRYTVGLWQRYLKARAPQAGRLNGDAVFGPWRVLSAIRAEEFGTAIGPALLGIAADAHVNAIVRRELCTRPGLGSVADVAARYGEMLARYDREAPWEDGAAEELRLVLRGEGSPTEVSAEHITKRLAKPDLDRLQDLRNKIEALAVTHPGSPPRAQAMEDLATPVEPHILKRGNPGNVGDAVPRRFLALLSGPKREPFKEGSGRLELARAIASKDNPLTARVMVNRVWGWHFGQGLVRTPSDFGKRGDRPTHPELLDYLAVRFVTEDGWSVKKLQKRILMSATYRQSSVPSAAAEAADPEDRWLSHFPMRRLDFEELRDSLLMAGGTLDLTMYGRPVEITAEGAPPRRTVYAYIDRQNLPGLFRTFDFASPDATVGMRPNTSVPQQALFMLNSPFVIRQAKRVAASAKGDEGERVRALYRAVLGREPSGEEVSMALGFVGREKAQSEEGDGAEPLTPTLSPSTGRGGKTNGEQARRLHGEAASAWSYGYGAYDEKGGRMKSFTKMPHFAKTGGWQGGAALPDGKLGWALLTASGGHAGNDQAHAVIRRFTAPVDCVVSLTGTLEHKPAEGDGVRGRVIWSRGGTLGTYRVHHQSAKTEVSAIEMKKGETLDFVVDCGENNDVGYDQFGWVVKLATVAGEGRAAVKVGGGGWDSQAEFRGPGEKAEIEMDGWERLAQVLMESNEFMFVE